MSAPTQDLKYGLRMLAKSPGFTAVAVLTLALGIGATTAIFSLINAALLRPLPFRDPGRLYLVWGKNVPKGFTVDLVSAPDFEDWKAQSDVFESMAASTDEVFTLTGAGDPTPIDAYQLSAEFFHVLGVQPLIGRVFLPEEDQPGKDHEVLLGYGLWQRSFGGRTDIVGKSVMLSGEKYLVVGVMPKGFYYPTADEEAWTPLSIGPRAAHDRGARFLRVLARLKTGVTRKQAHAEMDAIAGRLAKEYPNTNKDQGISLGSLREMSEGDIRPALLALFGAVGFLLLIACANLANLLLARGTEREREVAVRVALGAGRFRLARQFLTESLLLALLGGGLGLLMALWGANTLVAMFPPTISNLQIPRLDQIPLDGKVLAFALLAAILTGAACGLVPALQASGLGVSEHLKDTARGATGGARGRRFRDLLVVGEMALSLILLAGAGLMVKSFIHLQGESLGFDPAHVLTLRVFLPDTKYRGEDQQRAFLQQALENIAALPGVESAGSVTFLPLSGWWGPREVSAVEHPPAPGTHSPGAIWDAVDPAYFQSLGIPLLKGRGFTKQDAPGASEAAILSESEAKRLFPAEDPIGKLVNVEGWKNPRAVVGVVADVSHFGAAGEHRGQVYAPFAQAPSQLICFAVRTRLAPSSLANSARVAIWAVDKDLAVSYVLPMEQLVRESVAPQRVSMALFVVFAALALVLASVGIYGVIAYSVGRRTHEIGLRMALGAKQRDVLWLVIRQGLMLVIAGVTAGLVGAWILTRLLASLLYGVRPADPTTYAIVSLMAVGVAALACYIPARRATEVDPMVALRYE